MRMKKNTSGMTTARARQSLDWPWLQARLAEKASSELGRQQIEALEFATSLETVRRQLAETSELRRLLDRGETLPMGGLEDPRRTLSAASKGEILTGQDFTGLVGTLAALDAVRRFFGRHGAEAPVTADRASVLPDLSDLRRRLADAFDAQGELSTAAFPELAQLRRKVYAVHARLREHLSNLLEAPEMESLLQDKYYTLRNDRYVLPVKVQHKNISEGIIHDASGSGQTAFIEPQSVIPMNNELKIAQGELKHEERRILRDLSEAVARRAASISDAVLVGGELDFILARARLSQTLDAVEPELNQDGEVHLMDARHPVLALRGLKVVANDIDLGTEHQAVVISGPNTGGKTVALKTLGLCALMVRAGLHIPVKSGSQMAVFSWVFADIGDTQTIEGDLSTFSGHITMIRDIADSVDEVVSRRRSSGASCLVLLDEIAVGTDPSQGAALAEAILMNLVNQGCRIVVTTHYTELKTLSTRDPRFASARVEYDGLRPTYRLMYGVPGRSFALDIARGLGLDPTIISAAEGLLSPEERAVDEVVGSLERELHEAKEAREAAQAAQRDAERLRNRYEVKLRDVESQVDRLKGEKLRAFKAEVNRANSQIREVVRELSAAPSGARVESARKRIKVITHKMKAAEPKAPERDLNDFGKAMDWGKAQVGDEVYLTHLNKTGRLIDLPKASGGLSVQIGIMKVRVEKAQVLNPRGVAAPPPKSESARRRRGQWEDASALAPSAAALVIDGEEGEDLVLDNLPRTPSNSLDLRGKRVDEGIDELDLFLDQASLRGEQGVLIIHGHGTGAMRRAVRAHLDASGYVHRHRAGSARQGGNGVTLAALS